MCVETLKKTHFDKLPEDLKMMLFDDWISLTTDSALAKQGKEGLLTALKEMYQEIRKKEVEFRGEVKCWKE